MNLKVEEYYNKVKQWKQELSLLREIILKTGLNEEFKWRVPCYMFEDSNILILNSFKDFCAVGFFKGVLLKDEKGILTKPGENSQSVRMIKFTSVSEVEKMESVLIDYINEAIEIEKAGLKVEKSKDELVFPEELVSKLDSDPKFKNAFDKLTPGRQRAYNMFFTAPKNSKTRVERIEKYEARILSGKGINDCVCGMSKKLPGCDGSHKNLREKIN